MTADEIKTGFWLRFWKRVRIGPGCWEWTGGKSDLGYGHVVGPQKGRRNSPHRVTYERAHGPIPEGLVIDHLCRNPSCCRPRHLRAVTHAVNILCGIGPSAKNAQKERCPLGHEYDEPVRWKGRVGRGCSVCRREGTRRWRRKMGPPKPRPIGESVKGHKLSADAIRAIRSSTEPQRAIAARHGIDQALVSRIKNRRAWKHVE